MCDECWTGGKGSGVGGRIAAQDEQLANETAASP